MKNKPGIFLNELGTAIGIGIMAGIVGTAAISISQAVEMKITDREPSTATVDVATKVLDVKPADKDKTAKVGQQIHWAYGTSWGVARGLISLFGLKGWKATAVHFGAIWATEMVMLPSMDIAPPVTEEEPTAIAVDGWHHLVYAVAAGITFDAIAEQTTRAALHNEFSSAKTSLKKKLASL